MITLDTYKEIILVVLDASSLYEFIVVMPTLSSTLLLSVVPTHSGVTVSVAGTKCHEPLTETTSAPMILA
jgi:hypothetical protein